LKEALNGISYRNQNAQSCNYPHYHTFESHDPGLHVKLFHYGIGLEPATKPGETWNFPTSTALYTSYWRRHRLKHDDAEWLKQEMMRILDELEQRQSKDGETFLVRLAFAPFHDG
jgi:hypothetical protein